MLETPNVSKDRINCKEETQDHDHELVREQDQGAYDKEDQIVGQDQENVLEEVGYITKGAFQ